MSVCDAWKLAMACDAYCKQGDGMFYTFPPSDSAESNVTKLSIPLTIVVLAAVLFLLCSAALVWEFCVGLPWIQAQQSHEACFFYVIMTIHLQGNVNPTGWLHLQNTTPCPRKKAKLFLL